MNNNFIQRVAIEQRLVRLKAVKFLKEWSLEGLNSSIQKAEDELKRLKIESKEQKTENEIPYLKNTSYIPAERIAGIRIN